MRVPTAGGLATDARHFHHCEPGGSFRLVPMFHLGYRCVCTIVEKARFGKLAPVCACLQPKAEAIAIHLRQLARAAAPPGNASRQIVHVVVPYCRASDPVL